MLEELIKEFSLSRQQDSELEIQGEIPFETLAPYRAAALSHLAEHMELPGFRKGHVPKDIVEKKVGEISLLEEAVEFFVRDFYPKFVLAKELNPVGRPEIRITKLAPGNPIALTIRTALFPEITLPDYKKIARSISKETPKEPADDEVEKAIEGVRMSRAVQKEGTAPEAPELTDEFVRTLGPFDTVASFKEKLREHLSSERAREAREKRRAKIADALIEKTVVEVPRVFVESELEKIVAQLKDDISRMGMVWEDYLAKAKKTEEEVRKEFRDGARKRAILQLALNAIAEKEAITVPAEDIKRQAEHVLDHFKDADRERVHIYAESVLKNEKVLSMLESQA